MANGATTLAAQFGWPVCHEAEQLIGGRIDAFLRRHAFAHRLMERMRDETGTDFFDWVDLLPRRGGFKDFNQKSVSAIIADTDARKVQVEHQS